MLGLDPSASASVDSIAHIIQTALTPVFLLSGIAALLNVFATRLARVSDRCHATTLAMDGATGASRQQLEERFRFLHRRSVLLDAAVLLGTAGGGSTCAAALLLFLGSLRDSRVAGLLYLAFGLALLCTAGALTAFLVEVLVASRGMRARQEAASRKARKREAVFARVSRTGDGGPPDV